MPQIADPGAVNKWKKPETVTGLLILGAVVAIGLYSWDKILPFLIRVTQNTLYFGVLLALLAFMVFLFTDKKIRAGVFFLVQMGLRALAGAVVMINPISVMKIYIDDLKKKNDEMSQKIDALATQKEKLDAQIKDNNEEIKEKMDEAKTAKQKGYSDDAISVYVEEAADKEEFNKKLIPLQANVTKALSYMEKVHESAGYLIKKMENKVKTKETEYNIIKASSNAMRSAMSIFKGDPDKKYIFELSVDQIQEEMASRLGEMKRAMEYSTDFINSVDIERGASNSRGLKMLEDYINTGTLQTEGPDADQIANTVSLTPDNNTSFKSLIN